MPGAERRSKSSSGEGGDGCRSRIETLLVITLLTLAHLAPSLVSAGSSLLPNRLEQVNNEQRENDYDQELNEDEEDPHTHHSGLCGWTKVQWMMRPRHLIIVPHVPGIYGVSFARLCRPLRSRLATSAVAATFVLPSVEGAEAQCLGHNLIADYGLFRG